MNYENITPQSQKVSDAILKINEECYGCGATINELVQATGIDAKVVCGNISDLIKRNIVQFYEAECEGDSDVYFHYGYEE
jgi:hypothetical protein